MVLQGATATLASVSVVHTEVLFLPLYKKQASFSDIDSFLRARGFLLNQMMPAGRTFKPLVWKNEPAAMMSQLLWADAIYVRNFLDFARLAPEQLLSIAAILHQNYGACDLAQLALGAYDHQQGTQLQQRYIEQLVGMNIGISVRADTR